MAGRLFTNTPEPLEEGEIFDSAYTSSLTSDPIQLKQPISKAVHKVKVDGDPFPTLRSTLCNSSSAKSIQIHPQNHQILQPSINDLNSLDKGKSPMHLLDAEKPQSNASFIQVVQTASAPSQVISDLVFPIKQVTLYQGKPSITFNTQEKSRLLAELKFVLVGKFTHGRPPMAAIHQFFAGLKLKGKFNLSLLDKKHIFIECLCKADYYYIWLKLRWSITGFPMRVFKWESDFAPSKESSIAPVWIRLANLPLYFFEVKALLSVANVIGDPIKIAPKTANRSDLGVASLCVELDVAKPLVDSIWINLVDDSSKVLGGFWVDVSYDVIPAFCVECCHIGHSKGNCKRLMVDSLLHGSTVDCKEPVLPQIHAENFGTEKPNMDGAGSVPQQCATQKRVCGVSISRRPAVDKTETAVQKVLTEVQDAVTVVEQSNKDMMHSAATVVGRSVNELAATSTATVSTAAHDQEDNAITWEKVNRRKAHAAAGLQTQVTEGQKVTLLNRFEQFLEEETATAICGVETAGADSINPGAELKENPTATAPTANTLTEGTKQTSGAESQSIAVVPSSVVANASALAGTTSPPAAATRHKQVENTITNGNSPVRVLLNSCATIQVDQVVDVDAAGARSVEQHQQVQTQKTIPEAARDHAIPETTVKGYLAEVSTPGSWADVVEEEERHEKKMNTGTKTIFTTNAKPFTRRSVSPTSRVSEKIKTFRIQPIDYDFDPDIRFHKDDKEAHNWSDIITGDFKLVARRSASPVGRSSEKLKRMRRRVDFIEHEAGKTDMYNRKIYLKNNEEFYQAEADYRRSLRRRHYHPRRDRGRSRGRGFGRGHGPGRFMGRGRSGRYRDSERTVIC